MKDIIDIISNSVFCYDGEEGQALVDKSKCECYAKGEKNCKAYIDSQNFSSRYRELEGTGMVRKEIIDILRVEFSESSWFQRNVIIPID